MGIPKDFQKQAANCNYLEEVYLQCKPSLQVCVGKVAVMHKQEGCDPAAWRSGYQAGQTVRVLFLHCEQAFLINRGREIVRLAGLFHSTLCRTVLEKHPPMPERLLIMTHRHFPSKENGLNLGEIFYFGFSICLKFQRYFSLSSKFGFTAFITAQMC